MGKKRSGIVMLQIPVPEGIRDELYEEIIEKCGYAKRGLLSEIVIDAIKEHLEKRKKIEREQINNKNGMV